MRLDDDDDDDNDDEDTYTYMIRMTIAIVMNSENSPRTFALVLKPRFLAVLRRGCVVFLLRLLPKLAVMQTSKVVEDLCGCRELTFTPTAEPEP